MLDKYSNILFSSPPKKKKIQPTKQNNPTDKIQVKAANLRVGRCLHDEVMQNRVFIMTLGHSLKLICQLEWRIDYNSFQTLQGGKT